MRYIQAVGGPVATSKRDRTLNSQTENQEPHEQLHYPPQLLKDDGSAAITTKETASQNNPKEESPPKRMKTETGSSPNREFGAELSSCENSNHADPNNANPTSTNDKTIITSSKDTYFTNR